jgi:protein-tyrosine phosphatase
VQLRPNRPTDGQPAIIDRVSDWFQVYGFAEITDLLLIGAYPVDEADVEVLEDLGIQRVLNLVEDREYRPGERELLDDAFLDAGIEESRLKLTDFGGLPFNELEAAVRQVSDWLDDELKTYLHCRAGWQRSAAVAAGVIALQQDIDIDDALSLIIERKPSADPLPHQREDLHRWFDTRARD